jgi:hypothetical protein
MASAAALDTGTSRTNPSLRCLDSIKKHMTLASLVTMFLIFNPSDPANTPSSDPLTLGLYVDDFVYFSAISEMEAKFQCLLKQHIKFNYMGMVEWFLGTHFQWSVTPAVVKVHLSQTGFASHLVEENNIHHCNITPNATPYWSGLPIDPLPPVRQRWRIPWVP